MSDQEALLVEVFSDGACSGNPGPGGWGAILRWQGQEKELSGAEAETTNNRMELLAVISALEAFKRPVRVRIYTDSRYVHDAVTRYMANWQRNGWKTANKNPVKNIDLWQRYLAAAQPHTIEWRWVKGHAGHVENERADLLARNAIKTAR